MGHPTPGWWDGLIGPGKAIDTNRHFVVCVNVLGGCQGTTGPASPHPDDGRPWASRFPVVTIRDLVRTQALLADHLGVRRWRSVVGGSMGGMQALEWAVMYPERVDSVAPIATTLAATAQQIGWWSTGRRIIRMDPRWRGGDYYDAPAGDGPHESLALARMVSQITFRSDDVFTDRFGREVVEPVEGFSLWQRFEVERYLEYHGDKLVRRFDANSYLLITKAMDLHDLGRGRGGVEPALATDPCARCWPPESRPTCSTRATRAGRSSVPSAPQVAAPTTSRSTASTVTTPSCSRTTRSEPLWRDLLESVEKEGQEPDA